MNRKQQKTPLTAAALSRIFGARLIRADGYDRSAIMKYARRWSHAQGVAFGAAQRRAWDVARGQMEKARAYDAGMTRAAARATDAPLARAA